MLPLLCRYNIFAALPFFMPMLLARAIAAPIQRDAIHTYERIERSRSMMRQARERVWMCAAVARNMMREFHYFSFFVTNERPTTTCVFSVIEARRNITLTIQHHHQEMMMMTCCAARWRD